MPQADLIDSAGQTGKSTGKCPEISRRTLFAGATAAAAITLVPLAVQAEVPVPTRDVYAEDAQFWRAHAEWRAANAVAGEDDDCWAEINAMLRAPVRTATAVLAKLVAVDWNLHFTLYGHSDATYAVREAIEHDLGRIMMLEHGA